MTITPVSDHVYIELEKVQKIGDLDTTMGSRKIAKEIAVVLECGPDVKTVKKGDKILVKGWGIDTFEVEKEQVCFVAESTNAICGIVTA